MADLIGHLLQSTGAHEGGRVRVGAAELLVQDHGFFGTALLQEGLAETLSRSLIEDARDYLVHQAHLLAYLLLKGTDVLRAVEGGEFLCGEFVPFHIQDRGGAKLAGGEALVEFKALTHLFHQLLRDGLTGAVIVGIGP